MRDYRPISLIGGFYKILSKVLEGRLKKVINKLVGEEQSAFIKERFILDSVLIASEAIDYAMRENLKSLIFKLDFQKAFDSIKWKFILHIMNRMGFGKRWCSWIKGCLSSASVSILVNGSPSNEFIMSKGVRQDDPLSPYLFLIAAEGLNVLMKDAVRQNIFRGIKVGSNGVDISHLQYADDTIMLGEWSRRNMKNLMGILNWFQAASGLKINLSKSIIHGIGVSTEEVRSWAEFFGCRAGDFPLSYLGLPIGIKMKNVKCWDPVVDKFKSRLSLWKAKCLSYGGRLTLLKSVLGGLPLYYFSLFRAPSKLLTTLERLRKNFFWGGGDGTESRMAWVKWDFILNSYNRGGLNIGGLREHNWGLLAKWWWRFRCNNNKSFWGKVITSIYGEDGGLNLSSNSRWRRKTIWGSIISIGWEIESHGVEWLSSMGRVLGDGSSIKFWRDVWVGESSLREEFPRLFRQDLDKETKICDRGSWRDENWVWVWNWGGNLRGRTVGELERLMSKLQNISLHKNCRDSWNWKLDPSGVFSVKALRLLLEEKLTEANTCIAVTTWNNLVPKKICVFVWRLIQKKLPVRDALDHRGIDLHSTLCPRCERMIETHEHCFIECDCSHLIWSNIFSWWNWDKFNSCTILDLIKHPGHESFTKIQKIAWEATIWAACYLIWNSRNEKVFRNKDPNPDVLWSSIQSRTYEWFSNRNHLGSLSWEKWKSNPLEAIYDIKFPSVHES